MYDPSLWAMSVAQGVQAGAMGKMAQEAQKAREKAEEQEKKRETAAAKASMEGILFSPFGQEKVLSVDLDRKSGEILFYTANGIYRVSAESDFAGKKLLVLRYFDSFDPKLNCHVIRLDKELQRIFPRGWSVDGQLIDGRRISFSSSNIDDVLNAKHIQEQIKSLEQSIARDEATIENRIHALTSEAQDKADMLPISLVGLCVFLSVPALSFFVLAFSLGHVWWTWLCFSLSCVLCALCGIAAKLLYKRPRVKIPQEKLEQDDILAQAKKELQAHRAELEELQGSAWASAGGSAVAGEPVRG